MPNLELFKTGRESQIPVADSLNEAGAPAYAFSKESQLAQMAMTGCLQGTFYVQPKEQLQNTLALATHVDVQWLAHLAVVARRHGFMKDMPALLLACLIVRDRELAERVFPLVIDNARMLRTFVQILRSGVVGRRSFGSAPRRWIRQWLASRTDEQLLNASVGNQPSLADIVKMVHPKPGTQEREAFWGWLLERSFDGEKLPICVRALLDWRAGVLDGIPEVATELLTDRTLSKGDWTTIAQRANWHWTRMNLETLLRHGVFEDKATVHMVAGRLRDRERIRAAKVFPYQLLMTWKSLSNGMPALIRDSVQVAMEHAVENVPEISGQIVVCPDVSGSMYSPITGYRGGASSAVRCVDVAALIAAALLRRNPQARVLPFKESVVDLTLNARDTIMANAIRMSEVGAGGTDCSAPLRKLNKESFRADLVVFVSDNESWMDVERGRGTATMREWEIFRKRNPQARLACIDLVSNRTTQAKSRPDILNIGGFSDQVFTLIREFASGRLMGDHWEREIDEQGRQILNAA